MTLRKGSLIALIASMVLPLLALHLGCSTAGGGGGPQQPTITSVTATCSPPQVLVGQTSQCTPNVQGTGNFNPAVTWSVQGGSANGTINQNGLYTAPDPVPNPPTVKVTAVSQQDISKSGSADISLSFPSPVVTASSPSAVIVGSRDTMVTLSGSGFTHASVASFNGVQLSTSFSSFTQLTATIPASNLTTAGTDKLTVSNPAPGGGQSNSVNFTVNNPQPSLSSISPSVLAGGSPDTPISLVGANFVVQSIVNLNGTALPISFVSSTQLGATVPASSLATGRIIRVTVTTPAPGGGTSGSVNLTVTELPPTGVSGPLIESLPPSAALVGNPIQHQVIASSANPSSLVFALSSSPTGMTINPTTGLLQWTPASNQVGDQPVTIAAQDSAGQTSQTFTLSVFGSRPVASATISAVAGGVITVNDPTSKINGLSISIPAGALAADTAITVSELMSPPTLGGTPRFLLKGFSIDPDGTPLATPAQVTIPYSTTEFDTTQGIPLEDFLGVYFVNTSTGALEFLSNFSVNKVGHLLTGTVPHFSAYINTSIARLCPPPTNQSDCPNAPPAPSARSLLRAAVMVHGYQVGIPGFTLGDEGTWGRLRYLLAKLDSPDTGRNQIDAWRFDWDSAYTPFESSAGYLSSVLQYVESKEPGPQQSPSVNLVAHSFGGILVRTYLEGYATDPANVSRKIPYRGDVNRVTTIGTPHSGIGGAFSTFFADACATLAQSDQAHHQPITCFEASTGIANDPFTSLDTGAFLKTLNQTTLPALGSFLTPQYDIIAGKRSSCPLIGGACSFRDDDGLITTEGANLCKLAVGCSASSKAIVQEETNPGSSPANTGFCHSGALLSLTCTEFGASPSNIAMVRVGDEQHPLWEKICTFLGCKPTLTVASTNSPSGAFITVSPTDNSGQSSGTTQFTLTYNSGTVVTLMAASTTGANNFSKWTGCDSVSGSACTVTMNADRTVTANYVNPMTRILTVASTNPTSGVTITVSPLDTAGQSNGTTQFTRTYNDGVVVTLSAPATAVDGNNFSSWTGCDSNSGTNCTVTMNANRTVTANYASPPVTTLTVASTKPNTGVAITVSPADNVGQSDGITQFTRSYNNGVAVSLVAAATAGGNNFFSWTGCDSNSGTNCTVTMNANRTVTANYGPTSPDKFAYQVNLVCGEFSLFGCISIYSIDGTTGALSRAGSPASADSDSAAMAVDPSGKFAYVVNASSNDVSMYTIDMSGGLTPIPTCPGCVNTVPAGQGPFFIAMHPSGKFAYVLNSGDQPTFVYTLGTNGALTQTSSFPGGSPNSIAIHPSGSFLYVADGVFNEINTFAVSPTTGDLTLIDSRPVDGYPFGFVLHPSGKFAYALHQSADEVLVFTIDTNGKLTPASTASTGSGSGPVSVVMDPLGKFAYVLYAPNGGPGQNITAYTVDATGALTGPQTFAPAPGLGLNSLTVERLGKFAYVVGELDFSCNPLTSSLVTISAYTIDRGTGLFTLSGKLCTDFGGKVVVTSGPIP